MRRFVSALVLMVPPVATAAQDAGTEPTWRMSGYVLSLLTRSTTVFPGGDRYTLDLNRFRLGLDGEPVGSLRIQVQYDNELLLGSYLRTRQFERSADRTAETSLDLGRSYASWPSAIGRHRIYRAVVTWSGSSTDVIVGRQRIAWGNGRFWSPADVLNPFDPARLEREEREGLDAVLVSRSLGTLARMSGVVAPRTRRAAGVLAAHAQWNMRGADYSVLVGTVRGEQIVGADFSGQLGGWGIRGEATVTRADTGQRFLRAMMGIDYGFPNTLTLTGELYFNGQGAANRDRYDFPGLFEGRIRSLAQRYGAIALSYEVTPLLRLQAFGVVNVDDRSRLLWPGIEYSVASNLVLSAGLQTFSGGPGGEYSRVPDVLYGQGKWFF